MGDELGSAGSGGDTLAIADRARSVIAAAKRDGQRERIVIRSGPGGSAAIGSLSPVNATDVSTPGFVELLTRWRAEHAQAFASQFRVTPEGTGRWLRDQIISNPDRILFVVRDAASHPVGHVGIVLHGAPGVSAEVDAVLRGEEAAAGMMTAALRTLQHWVETQLSVADIWLRALASNARALDFYSRLGFAEVAREVLMSERTGDTVELVTGPGMPVDAYVTMRLIR